MTFFNPLFNIVLTKKGDMREFILRSLGEAELTGRYPDVIIKSIAPVAQRIELGIPNPSAAGSIPARCDTSTNYIGYITNILSNLRKLVPLPCATFVFKKFDIRELSL